MAADGVDMRTMAHQQYKHIFFDLDHTLWDFEKNSAEALHELYVHHQLADRGGFMADAFVRTFHEVNEHLWRLYGAGKLDSEHLRKKRFGMIFSQLGADESAVPETLPADYLQLCPTKPHVLPYTYEILDYLKSRYVLHILTNGFADVQTIKLESARLSGYFVEIVTSNTSGYKKPHRKFFDFALEKTKASQDECIMIGDNLEADVLGARNAGLDHVFFNPKRQEHDEQLTHEISCLSQIKDIL